MTAGKGFSATVGNKFTVSVDVKGGPLEVALFEYGNKKYMFTGDTPENFMNASKFLSHANTFGMNLDIDVLLNKNKINKSYAKFVENRLPKTKFFPKKKPLNFRRK